jgi:hypothetical protein
VQRLTLEYGCAPGWVFLRELRGDDEESVTGTDSRSAIELLERLLVAAPGAVLAGPRAAELAVADRDLLLAAVYRAAFGARVSSTVACHSCPERFDVDFSLDDLLASMRPAAFGIAREADGVFRMADGRRFRLPTGVDETAAAALPEERRERELLQRCLIPAGGDNDLESLSEAMQKAGPLLDLETEARCPECGTAQPVRFDMQHYVLSRIRGEARARAFDVHRLARAYGWPLSEILELPRSRRRLYVDLIEREPVAR